MLSIIPMLHLRAPDSKKRFSILQLPNYPLEKIFSYVNLRDVRNYRMVCRTFNEVGKLTINMAFKALKPKIDYWLIGLRRSIINALEEEDIIRLLRRYNLMEVVKTEYEILRTVLWRPVRENLVCFSAVEIINEFNMLLILVSTSAATQIGSLSHTKQLRRLCSSYIAFFEKHIEPSLVHKYPYGVKVVDTLNCAYFCDRKMVLTFNRRFMHMNNQYMLRKFPNLHPPAMFDEKGCPVEEKDYGWLQTVRNAVREHCKKVLVERALVLTLKSLGVELPQHGQLFFHIPNPQTHVHRMNLFDDLTREVHEDSDNRFLRYYKGKEDIVVEVQLSVPIKKSPLFFLDESLDGPSIANKEKRRQSKSPERTRTENCYCFNIDVHVMAPSEPNDALGPEDPR